MRWIHKVEVQRNDFYNRHEVQVQTIFVAVISEVANRETEQKQPGTEGWNLLLPHKTLHKDAFRANH